MPVPNRPFLGQGYLDSNNRAGPTLQKVADKAIYNRQKAQALEGLFDVAAPLVLTSTEAEASPAMARASKLAKLFQDWFVNGKPVINVREDTWKDVIKSGKFKNQMELTSKLDAWDTRVHVERKLGNVPNPYNRFTDESKANLLNNLFQLEDSYVYDPIPNDIAKKAREIRNQLGVASLYGRTPTEALKHPIYGHIYNPEYTNRNTASMFGDTYAEMSQHVKDNSRYVLGDSFEPFIDKAFTADDMYGKTSALERSLFDGAKKAEQGLQRNGWSALNDQRSNMEMGGRMIQAEGVPYMEMWVPNSLSRLNNVNSIHTLNGAIAPSVMRRNPDALRAMLDRDR